MNFSLRNLLLSVGFVAATTAGLRYGGPVAMMIVTLIALSWCAMTIRAVVGNSTSRIFAIGFSISFFLYFIAHFAFTPELNDLRSPPLPTSAIVGLVYSRIVKVETVDKQTGRLVPEEFPMITGGWRGTDMRITPGPNDFAILSHAVFAVLIGLAGGWYAVRVNGRIENG